MCSRLYIIDHQHLYINRLSSSVLSLWSSSRFDEMHIGKFVNFYIRGFFFLDTEPPLGKMVLAGIGELTLVCSFQKL